MVRVKAGDDLGENRPIRRGGQGGCQWFTPQQVLLFYVAGRPRTPGGHCKEGMSGREDQLIGREGKGEGREVKKEDKRKRVGEDDNKRSREKEKMKMEKQE